MPDVRVFPGLANSSLVRVSFFYCSIYLPVNLTPTYYSHCFVSLVMLINEIEDSVREFFGIPESWEYNFICSWSYWPINFHSTDRYESRIHNALFLFFSSDPPTHPFPLFTPLVSPNICTHSLLFYSLVSKDIFYFERCEFWARSGFRFIHRSFFFQRIKRKIQVGSRPHAANLFQALVRLELYFSPCEAMETNKIKILAGFTFEEVSRDAISPH